jgi:DNA-binding transcriptional ArsR family regulator
LSARAYDQVAPVLRVLGHADRLRMVDVLLRQDLPVAELAEQLALAANAVSQHLSIMRAHGIVRKQRRGRQVFYKVDHPAAKSVEAVAGRTLRTHSC